MSGIQYVIRHLILFFIEFVYRNDVIECIDRGRSQRIKDPDMKRQSSAGIDRALIRSREHPQKYNNGYPVAIDC